MTIPMWRFCLPLAFQAALIIFIPAQAIYTQMTGKTVILQTAPVDPSDPLRGYFQRLRYNISSQQSLRELPGWQELPKQYFPDRDVTWIEPGTQFYVILAAPNTSETANTSSIELPPAWQPLALSAEHPSQLPPKQVALKALAQNGFIQYGLETYYIPEDQRQQINADLREIIQAQQDFQATTPPVVMEIKVDSRGNAVLISLWVQLGESEQQQVINYRF